MKLPHKMHFDDLLKILGEIGRYQKTRLFLICLFGAVCAFHAMNMVFVGAKPKYQCVAPPVNVSNPLYRNITEEEIQDFLISDGNCEMYSSSETIHLLLSGHYSFDEIKSQNVTVSKDKCENWVYSREVYGPTIVTQVSHNIICITYKYVDLKIN